MPSLGKVLITGGCGFLGSHIISLILRRHPQTQIVVIDLRTDANRNLSSNVSYYDGDITNFARMEEIFSKTQPDSVIHTASPTAFAPAAIHDKVNIEGTKNLLRVSQESRVKAFVYTSSASVILDPTSELVNADETYPLITGARQPEYYTTTKVSFMFPLDCMVR